MSKLSVQNEFRVLQGLDVGDIDEEKRTVRLTGSSEYPVERLNYATGERYVEILSHDPADVDLSRMKDGGPVLDRHWGDQIAVIEEAAINAERKVEYLIRFSDATERANAIFRDVVKKIRRNVSSGYSKLNIVKTEKIDGGRRSMHYFRWQPFELSFEPVPADPTVGVGRSLEASRRDIEFTESGNNDGKRAVSLIILTKKKEQ